MNMMAPVPTRGAATYIGPDAPCVDNALFYEPSTAADIRACQALCRFSCRYRSECRASASQVIADGLELWGVWYGEAFGGTGKALAKVTGK